MERDEVRDDSGMIGSETQEPGPGRDTSLTDPDPVAAAGDPPRGTVAMSPDDPLRTRLGAHVEGAGVIGHDVAAAEAAEAAETADDATGREPDTAESWFGSEPAITGGTYEPGSEDDRAGRPRPPDDRA